MWVFIPIVVIAWFIYAYYQYKHEVPIQRALNRAEADKLANEQGTYYDFYGNLLHVNPEWKDPAIVYREWLRDNPCGETLYQDEDYQMPSGVVLYGGRYTGRTK